MNSVMVSHPVAEPDFRLIFESTCGPYLILNPELQIVAVSNAYLTVSRATREMLLGMSIFDTFPAAPGDTNTPGINNLRGSLDRVREHLATDAMAVQKYGIRASSADDSSTEERYWGATNQPVLDAGGRLRYIIHHIDDMTDLIRSRTEKPAIAGMAAPPLARDRQSLEIYLRSQEAMEAHQQLQQATAVLAAANRELESLSYAISHDLRAPLRAIDGFSRLLSERMKDRMDAEDQRLIAVIRDSSKTMGQLIDGLLKFSRVSRTRPRIARVDMKAMVERQWQDIGTGFPGRLQLGELPWASCDASLMQMVWESLLSNSVKYTARQKDPLIEISGGTDDLGSIYHIRDNGVGFDMQFLHKLFNVFQRLHGSADYPGTGIGLAIAARIISLHGGRIWAEGVPGDGACFHFTIPDPEKSPGGASIHATR